MTLRLLHGDCREQLRTLEASSVDSIVTDPPYELGFMGKSWDASGIAYDVGMWREALRVLKPGGHLLAFSGSRTYHRMTVAIEDAGFEIRDQIMWIYGSGFPKSLDVSKAIDRAAGAEREVVGKKGGRYATPKQDFRNGTFVHGPSKRSMFDDITAPATDTARQWTGWGTALKPAHEPICMARKPLEGTVVGNVLKHGTGAMNIDGCRVPTSDNLNGGAYSGGERPMSAMGLRGEAGGKSSMLEAGGGRLNPEDYKQPSGRWPANVIHDGSDEVSELFPDGAARFFYNAKASAEDREECLEGRNQHPTVKPTDLMRYLCRLVTPPGGVVLDPFMGSGSTGKAALMEHFAFIGIEQSAEYLEIARARIKAGVPPLWRNTL